MLGPDPKTFFEIGTFNAGTLCFLMLHPYATKLYSIDPYTDCDVKEALKNIELHNLYHKNFLLFNGKSVENFTEVKKYVQQIDILFIDGNQTYFSVIKDFNTYEPMVSPLGFIIIDDYNNHIYCPEVKPAIDTIISKLDPNKYNIIGCVDIPKDILPNHYANPPFIIQKLF
jgi:predicted O-methyltransferase YrrM